MKLPFSIDLYYTTTLSKKQVQEELGSLSIQKSFGGLRTDSFVVETLDTGFSIVCKTYGFDGFTLERWPTVQGSYVWDSPLTINICIKPNYFQVAFFALFVLIFLPASIFIDQMTINGVLRMPTVAERIGFAALGAGIPGMLCYFGYIRPVGKAQRWIVDKLNLAPEKNNY